MHLPDERRSLPGEDPIAGSTFVDVADGDKGVRLRLQHGVTGLLKSRYVFPKTGPTFLAQSFSGVPGALPADDNRRVP